jgi:two-component system cell cycle response regulator
VKAQNRLAWIYCIIINDQINDQMDPADESEIDECLFLGFHLTDLKQQIAALEAGADAYMCFSAKLDQSARSLFGQLFQAQIQAGLRQVQTHRELMRTNDVLSAIALSDPLTSLNNRRAFEWELPRQIQNARSRSVPISLVMLDVDFFKSINDTYGHLVGDQVLKFLAARLQHNLRIYDTPFRYGGEEFVVILSNTDFQEALLIANRLCQLIGEQPFAIDETIDLTVTISAGTATLKPDDDPKGMSLLQRADQCLLQAKVQGRNRVIGCG